MNEKSWSYNYEDLKKLTGKALNTIYQHASRQRRGVASGFDPGDFHSVVLWVFRNATDEVRLEILNEMNFFRRPDTVKRLLKKQKAGRRTRRK